MTEEEFMISIQDTQKLWDTQYPQDSLSIDDFQSEDYTIRQNERIIKAADNLVLERMENKDGSLRLGEVIQAKDVAFKHNQKIQWIGDEWPQLIPSQINIQIINN